MIPFRAVVVAVVVAMLVALAPALEGQGASGVTVEFIDFDTATPNARPHDPAFGPDGSLWYTGQRSHTLGRVDGNGAVREFALPGPAWPARARDRS